MSVEGLRAAFDKIDARARSAIEAGKPDSVVSGEIEKAWTDMFHHGLSASAVKGLTLHYRAVYRSRRTRKHKQRGGMAPLDWTMGQGTTMPVYGSFPVEVGASPRTVGTLDMDRYFKSSISSACDDPLSQKGGGLLDTIFAGHAPTSAPPNVAQYAENNLTGQPRHYPSSAPEMRAWNYSNPTPAAFNPAGLSSISTLAPVYAAPPA